MDLCRVWTSNHTTGVPSLTMDCAAIFDQVHHCPVPPNTHIPQITSLSAFFSAKIKAYLTGKGSKSSKQSKRIRRVAAFYRQKRNAWIKGNYAWFGRRQLWSRLNAELICIISYLFIESVSTLFLSDLVYLQRIQFRRFILWCIIRHNRFYD